MNEKNGEELRGETAENGQILLGLLLPMYSRRVWGRRDSSPLSSGRKLLETRGSS